MFVFGTASLALGLCCPCAVRALRWRWGVLIQLQASAQRTVAQRTGKSAARERPNADTCLLGRFAALFCICLAAQPLSKMRRRLLKCIPFQSGAVHRGWLRSDPAGSRSAHSWATPNAVPASNRSLQSSSEALAAAPQFKVQESEAHQPVLGRQGASVAHHDKLSIDDLMDDILAVSKRREVGTHALRASVGAGPF